MTVDGDSISNHDNVTLIETEDTSTFEVSLDSVIITEEVEFTVADTSIVSVDANGVMTAEGYGSTTVTITYQDSESGYIYKRIYYVTVREELLVLLSNGESEYSIVVPHETYLTMKDYSGSGYSTTESAFCNDALRVAAHELRLWFKEATGADLNIVSDSGLSHASGQKYISLGNTALYQSCGVALTEEEKAKISSDGSKIFSVDENIYLIGGTDKGTCFAVYDWFNDLFGLDFFSRDSYYIDDSISLESETENKTLKIQSVNKLVLPSIGARGASISGSTSASAVLAGAAYTNSETGVSVEEYANLGIYNTAVYKYRIRLSDDIYFPIHTNTSSTTSRKTTIHNTLEFLASSNADYNNFQKATNDFSSLDQNWIWEVETNSSYYDICFSAHGDATSYNNMVAHFANKILFSLQTYTEETYPAYNTVTISPEDGWRTASCTCDTCSALAAKYGASYAGLKFVDDVAKKLDELLVGDNAEYRRNDFHLLYFAYAGLLQAPACTSACSAAEIAAFNTFKSNLHDWVGVYYATGEFSYFNDIDSDVNASAKANALAWGDLIADKGGMTVWTYSTNYWHYLYYFDSVAFFETKAYQFFVNDCGAYQWRNQNQSGQYGVSSAFSNLQVYLDYQLMWDCNQNSEELIVKWFQNKFGDAWDEMFAVFNEMRADFRQTVMPNASYETDTAENAVAYQTARDKGFIDYNIVGSADEITTGTAAYNGNFSLYDNSLPFANGKTVVYSVETAMDWLQMFDAAYTAFESQMTSAGLTETDLEYQVLKKAIDTEWLSPAYVVLNRNNASLLDYAESSDGNKSVLLKDLKTQFKETVYRTRLVQFRESTAGACFDYSTFAENELFFETLGYRGIMTSLYELLPMKASVDGGSTWLTWANLVKRGVAVGEEVVIFINQSGTNFDIETYSITISPDGVFSDASSVKVDGVYYNQKYTALTSGTATVTLTYMVDGVTHTTTATLTVF